VRRASRRHAPVKIWLRASGREMVGAKLGRATGRSVLQGQRNGRTPDGRQRHTCGHPSVCHSAQHGAHWILVQNSAFFTRRRRLPPVRSRKIANTLLSRECVSFKLIIFSLTATAPSSNGVVTGVWGQVYWNSTSN